MAEKLTPQQKEAVMNRGGKLLVSAAAGSGKTKVLVDRLMSYVLDPSDPANLDEFLIITYTKAAAAELRGKISKKLIELMSVSPNNRHLQQQMQRLHLANISTVHSFCSDILREYAYRLDLSADFRVADELESNQLQMMALDHVMSKAYDTIAENPYFRDFIDTQGLGRDDRSVPKIVLKVYNSAMCHLDWDGWLQWCVESSCVDDIEDAAQTVWGKYLLDDLRSTVRFHRDALDRCRALAEVTDGFDKPSALLAATVAQLDALENCHAWDEIVRFGKIDYGRLTFSKKCTDLELIEQIKAIRNACKKAMDKKLVAFCDESAQVLADLKISSNAAKGLVQLVRDFEEYYHTLKNRRRVLDFSDLEHSMLDLLLGKKRTGVTSAAKEIAERFREIMVDEYQDSNGVQDAIFGVLTQSRQNCFMVGDVKQSIYQFRLADPGIFIDKYNSYEPAENALQGQGRKVLLCSNFRSSHGIISAVNFVFEKCMSEEVGGLTYGTDEKLNEGIPHISLEEPEVELYGIEVEKDTYAEEAAFVAQRIEQLLNGNHMIRRDNVLSPIKASDIVILLRSPGSVGGEFRYALEQRGIRCFTGSNGDLLSAQEIVALRSFLQVIDNPLQDIPLVAAMASPLFAFSADDLAQLRSTMKKGSIYEAVKRDGTDKSKQFIATLNSLRIDASMCSVSELLARIFKKTNLQSIYGAMPNGEERMQNLYAFCQLASGFENSGRKNLSYFLQYLETLEERGVSGGSAASDGDGVTIMSIHKSKGLEFPVVFLCGLSRRFNEDSAREQVLCHKELGLGLSCVNTSLRYRYPSVAKRAISTKILAEGLSEELRVLYVAMTRARDRLIMTYAVKNLESDLQEIAARKEHSPKNLLTSEVSCPGEWILLSAMCRIEAGEFFALSGMSSNTVTEEPYWKIAVVRAPDQITVSQEFESCENVVDMEQVEMMKAGLSFRYDHSSATMVPSKQTATQLKGREIDKEVSEGTLVKTTLPFREPTFTDKKLYGKEYGTSMHTVMQYICYENCCNVIGVEEEVKRILKEGLISQEQADAVNCQHIAKFFHTELGNRLLTHSDILREFKFSVLIDAQKYYTDVSEEKILLQGVVDCALVDEKRVTIVDFKSDRVDEENVADVVKRYCTQVNAYKDALAEIFEGKEVYAYLYFFRIGRLVEVE